MNPAFGGYGRSTEISLGDHGTGQILPGGLQKKESCVEKIDCTRCAHYLITWITGTPYGCAAWGIKSSRLPHQEVYAASGIQCQLFSPKREKKGAGGGK